MIELMVSMSIFAGIATLAILLMHQNQRAAETSIAHADASASIMLVYEKIKAEMKSSRVIGSDPVNTLQYWIYQQNGNGTPVFGGLHGLVFLPGPGSDPDVATLSLQQGLLIREFQGQNKNLASLGDEGEINFRWDPAAHVLMVRGQVVNPYQKSRTPIQPRKFSFLISLNNVE